MVDDKEFYEKVVLDFFNNVSCDLEDLKKMLSEVMPVFGKLETDIITTDLNRVITFKDIDDSKNYLLINEESPIEMKDIMSGIFLKITVNFEGYITFIEHGCPVITGANKNKVLFLAFLIGKKIII